MAIVTKSIGTGKDYTTITLWEADLDNTGEYNAADDAVGECYNQTYDESVTFDGGGTVGLSSVRLSVAAGERHDGTAGTGARVVATGNVLWQITGTSLPYTVEWMEIDWNSNESGAWHGMLINSAQSTHIQYIRNCILHDYFGSGSNHMYCLRHIQGPGHTLNNIVYNVEHTGINNAGGIIGTSPATHTVYNNTVYNAQGNSGSAWAIFVEDRPGYTVKNNIGMGGDTSDYSFLGTSPDSSNNLSGDTTAADGGGTGHQINKVIADQFVSTVNGSEDLHIKEGSDAIDNGVDLGTTPSGVEIDIDGRDRHANDDIWDIGAHELITAGPAGAVFPPVGSEAIHSKIFTGHVR